MRWTWGAIEKALGPAGGIAAAVSAVLVDAGERPVNVGTVYVWKSRGIARSMRWALADALRRAGHNVRPSDLADVLYSAGQGPGPSDPSQMAACHE